MNLFENDIKELERIDYPEDGLSDYGYKTLKFLQSLNNVIDIDSYMRNVIKTSTDLELIEICQYHYKQWLIRQGYIQEDLE